MITSLSTSGHRIEDPSALVNIQSFMIRSQCFYYSCLCALSVLQLLKDDLYLITLSNENSIVGRSATEMLWQDAPKYRHSRYRYQLGCSVVQMSAGLQQ